MLMFGKPNVYFPTSCRMVKEWCVSMLTFGNLLTLKVIVYGLHTSSLYSCPAYSDIHFDWLCFTKVKAVSQKIQECDKT